MTDRTKTPDITLYGTSRTGAGWLALLPPHGRLFGTGEPVTGKPFSHAVWEAAAALFNAGYLGPVTLYDTGGERMTTIHTDSCIPPYGELKWVPAIVFEIPVALFDKEAK